MLLCILYCSIIISEALVKHRTKVYLELLHEFLRYQICFFIFVFYVNRLLKILPFYRKGWLGFIWST